MRNPFFSFIFFFCAVAVSAAQNFNVAPSLRKHVEYLASDSLEGRAAGSPGEKAAASYIYKNLEKAGVVMLTGESGQDFTIADPSGDISSCNILGIVQGCDSLLRSEYIVVGAHYDGVGCNRMTVNGQAVNQIYPGADANASGVSMLIELARQVALCDFMFPRSIIFVCFGAGEKSVAGSWYFANRAFEGMDKVKAMIDLNMLGHRSASNPFQLLSQISRGDMDHILDLTGMEPISIMPQPSSNFTFSSDFLPFYEKKIPVFCFTTGLSRESRSFKDVPSSLSYQDMEMECNYIYYFLKDLASCGDDMPTLNEGAVKKKVSGSDRIYSASECDKRPQFFHSDERHFLKSWVYKYVRYPAQAIKEGIQGTVMVSFIVEKNGELSDIKVVEGVDELLDEEALRVVRVSPKWIPGQVRGVKVRTRITIPVQFILRKN